MPGGVDPMPGRFDEISYKLGQAASGLTDLRKAFETHCADDDRRHSENLAALRANTAAIDRLARAMEPIAASVAFMRPIVDSYQVTRIRLAAYAAVAMCVLGLVGWAVQMAVNFAIAWAAGHWK